MTYTVNSGAVTIAADGTATFTGNAPALIGDQPVWYPPVAPEAPLDAAERPNIRRVTFGDGYEQRSPKGMNHVVRTASLTFGNLRPGTRDQVLAFLRERGGYKPFWYQIPGDGLRRWIAPEWGTVIKTFEFHNVTVRLERAWDPPNNA